ncbi:unnamed protein product [Cuscuta epithymum]|uniref:Uncharacterized protein n=1 Tax=Cuscuta epithymum TaxID=186058 RepID=A0AAV0G615_9ASTE|nr:unnamed protein product [Cuscuta epithymum]
MQKICNMTNVYAYPFFQALTRQDLICLCGLLKREAIVDKIFQDYNQTTACHQFQEGIPNTGQQPPPLSLLVELFGVPHNLHSLLTKLKRTSHKHEIASFNSSSINPKWDLSLPDMPSFVMSGNNSLGADSNKVSCCSGLPILKLDAAINILNDKDGTARH